MKHYQSQEPYRKEPVGMLCEFLMGLSIATAKWIVYGGIAVFLIWGLCNITDNTKASITALRK